MSTVTNKVEKAVAYAALILADEALKITPEKLQTLLKAAGIEDVEPIWTTLFAKALEGKPLKDFFTSIEISGSGMGEGGVDNGAENGKQDATGNPEGQTADSEGDLDLGSDDDGVGFGGLFD